MKPSRDATEEIWAEYWATIRAMANEAAKHNVEYQEYARKYRAYGWYPLPYEQWSPLFRDAVVSQ